MNDRIAIVYLRASDGPPAADLYSRTELEQHYFDADGPIKKFWAEVSHGKYQYTGQVFYPAPLSLTMAQIQASNEGYVLPALSGLLGATGLPVPGLDLDQFDLVFVLLAGTATPPYQPMFGGGFKTSDLVVNGRSYRKRAISFVFRKFTRGYWFSAVPSGVSFTGIQDHDRIRYPELGLWDEDSTMLHEWGHSLGLHAHAHFLRVDQEPMQGNVHFTANNIPRGYLGDDYGDYFDIMGNGHYAMHLNAGYQDKLGWFDSADIVRLSQSQADVRLTPLEGTGTVRAAQITPLRPISLQLDASASQWQTRLDAIEAQAKFYVEYRRAIGFDKHLSHPYVSSNTEGLLIHLDMPSLTASERGTWLLDMSPDATAPSARYDDHHLAALMPGHRFYDPNSQVMIGNVRPDGDAGVTFDVVLGDQPGIPAGVSAEPIPMLRLVGATASSELSAPYNGKPQTAQRLIEGPNSGFCFWNSADDGSDPTPWFTLELEGPSRVRGLTLRWKQSNGRTGARAMKYRVLSSMDGTTWTDTGVSQANVRGLTVDTAEDKLPGWDAETRFIKVEMSDSSYTQAKYFTCRYALVYGNRS